MEDKAPQDAIEAPVEAPKARKKKGSASMRDRVKALSSEDKVDLSNQIRTAAHQVGGEGALALEVALYFDRLGGKS